MSCTTDVAIDHAVTSKPDPDETGIIVTVHASLAPARIILRPRHVLALQIAAKVDGCSLNEIIDTCLGFCLESSAQEILDNVMSDRLDVRDVVPTSFWNVDETEGDIPLVAMAIDYSTHANVCSPWEDIHNGEGCPNSSIEIYEQLADWLGSSPDEEIDAHWIAAVDAGVRGDWHTLGLEVRKVVAHVAGDEFAAGLNKIGGPK